MTLKFAGRRQEAFERGARKFEPHANEMTGLLDPKFSEFSINFFLRIFAEIG